MTVVGVIVGGGLWTKADSVIEFDDFTVAPQASGARAGQNRFMIATRAAMWRRVRNARSNLTIRT
ncbi:MAG: hypothetical protein ABI837_09995 [Acidobacteriota bacterium]